MLGGLCWRRHPPPPRITIPPKQHSLAASGLRRPVNVSWGGGEYCLGGLSWRRHPPRFTTPPKVIPAPSQEILFMVDCLTKPKGRGTQIDLSVESKSCLWFYYHFVQTQLESVQNQVDAGQPPFDIAQHRIPIGLHLILFDCGIAGSSNDSRLRVPFSNKMQCI